MVHAVTQRGQECTFEVQSHALSTTTAAAPSLSIEALPAVTVPPSLKDALSLARTSGVVSGRTPSSRATVFALGPLPTVTGTTSAANAPRSQAAAARW